MILLKALLLANTIVHESEPSGYHLRGSHRLMLGLGRRIFPVHALGRSMNRAFRRETGQFHINTSVFGNKVLETSVEFRSQARPCSSSAFSNGFVRCLLEAQVQQSGYGIDHRAIVTNTIIGSGVTIAPDSLEFYTLRSNYWLSGRIRDTRINSVLTASV